jgi:DMSO/TMAO reductase YedYZ molybdopterin-dependent catalytic subunit
MAMEAPVKGAQRDAEPAGGAAAGRAGAAAGVAAAALSLGVAELLAALLPGGGSPVGTVGERVIDGVPAPVKDAAIALFGTANKLVLVLGILVVCAVAAAVLGVAAARRPRLAVAGWAALVAVGVAAAWADPQVRAVPTGAATAVGAVVGLLALRRLQRRAGVRPAPETGQHVPRLDRRGFGRAVVVVAAAGALAGLAGQRIAVRARAAAARATALLPAPRRALPPPPPGAELGIEGLSPVVTPNDEFYRIDTALAVPRVDLATWQLTVDGMVDRPLTLTYDDLLRLPLEEADVTLTCVSNEVGGSLVGNARWLGVRLDDLLAMAAVRPAATQVVGRSVDGWTAGFPTAVARDGRPALVAVGMNGEPLPIRHGFPARLVVPGLYGYVSATKWLSRIELTTWDAFDGYWVPRGWAKEGPVKTASRIDVPRQGSVITPGPAVVAGVAWAQHRGIERVEVRIDDGAWQEATLAEAISVDTWRQWSLPWTATAGRHRIDVRATDGAGETQTEERARPAPDGATGWHSVRVTVAE